MITFKNLTLLFLLIATSAFAAVDYTIEFQPQAIEKALLIEPSGILKQKENGYLYVEVSRDFIAKIIPLIEVEGEIIPTGHYTSKKGIGPHISVMDENEQVTKIKELGKIFFFEIKELHTIQQKKFNKVRKLWLLTVEAPALEYLRTQYGLSPLLKKHAFHITIGTEIPALEEAAA